MKLRPPLQASGHRSFPGRIQRPKARAAETGLLSQAAERQGPGLCPHWAPIVAGPSGPMGSRGPAPALTSRAAAPGRAGPGRAQWPRVPPRPPRRGLRWPGRRGRPRREAAGRPGRRGLAPTERRSSLAAALAASEARGPRQENVPLSARAPGRPGGNTHRRQESSAESRPRLLCPRARGTAIPS